MLDTHCEDAQCYVGTVLYTGASPPKMWGSVGFGRRLRASQFLISAIENNLCKLEVFILFLFIEDPWHVGRVAGKSIPKLFKIPEHNL